MKKVPTIIFATIFLLLVGASAKAAPLQNPANGHYYEIIKIDEGILWPDANDKAKSLMFQGLQGHLATVTSREENDWLAENFECEFNWIGGFQDVESPDYAEPDGAWKWVTGEEWGYTNWLSGEPNNFGGSERYLAYYFGERWNDIDSSLPGYLLEYEQPNSAYNESVLFYEPVCCPVSSLAIERFQITDDSHQENGPAIYKNLVVYSDWGGGETGIDLRIYNLETKEDSTLVVKNGHQKGADIWGGVAVFTDWQESEEGIYGINLKTLEQFPIVVTSEYQVGVPAIYKNIIVWPDNRNGNNDIYGYNLKTKKEFQITNDSLNNYTPRIWGNKVVWYTKISGGYYNIEGYDLIKKEKLNISSKNNGYQSSPDIWEDKVVWVDSENGRQIYFKNLKTGKEKILTSGTDIRDVPRISHHYVTWVEGDGIGAHNIYVYDLATNQITQVSDDGPQQPSPTIPDIWNNTIVWMSWHTGNGDIYGAKILSSPYLKDAPIGYVP